MSEEVGCFLLLGEDVWSKKKYIKEVKERVLALGEDMMNYYELKEKEVTVDKIKAFIETLPFCSEYKLLYIQNTGYFKPGRKEEAEKFESILRDLPDYIVLLIDELEADKRGKLYKTIKSHHHIITFDFQGEAAVSQILIEKAKQEGVKIGEKEIVYFVNNMPEDMEYIFNEWHKLCSYAEDKQITKEMINNICIFSLEMRVFELVKKIAWGKSDEALQIYNRMLQSKESPIGILVLVARQFRIMYQIKYLLVKRQEIKQIAAQVKMPYFAVREIGEEVKKYEFKQLENLIKQCLETDRLLKTGQIEPARGVEVLIMQALNSKL